MFMELEEEQAVPRTKTGHVIFVTGEHHAFCVRVAILRSWTRISFSGSAEVTGHSHSYS